MSVIQPGVMAGECVTFCPYCLESWTYYWLDVYEDLRTSMLLEMDLYSHLDAHRGTI